MRLRRSIRLVFGFVVGTLFGIALAGCASSVPKPLAVGVLPGEAPQGKIKLPTQWYLDPVGESRPLGDFPMNMRLTPDGRFLAVVHCGSGTHEVMVFEVNGVRLVSRAPLPNIYYGLAFSADGAKLYVSGGETEVVYEFPFSEGFLSAPDNIRIAPEKERRVPCGVDVSMDGKLLAVAETWGNAVDIVDIASRRIVHQVKYPDETRPYDCRFDPSGVYVYVSLWGAAGVQRLRVDGSGQKDTVPTGDHPNELLLSKDGTRLFVANANVNTVSAIDTAAWRVTETLNTALYPDAPEGSTPNSLAVSPDGNQLFVANADNNSVAVFDISEPGRSRAVGLIPVGWYPTSVRVSADGKTVFVANGKGFTPFANPQGPNSYIVNRRTTTQHSKLVLEGTLSIIPAPTEKQYETYTPRVYACSPYRKDKQPVIAAPKGNPIPARVGLASPIKHCIYIIKENRTYDQVFGDMPEGNGDPALCIFPEKYTPNHHALAREFVLLDNFYVESQVSADGHEWSTAAYATDFVQKTWPSGYGGHGLDYPSEGAYRTAFPSVGYIWDRCREAKVSYRSYGEFISQAEDHPGPPFAMVDTLKDHFDPKFVGWDLKYLDIDRAKRFIEEFNTFVKAGTLPQFIVMRLPNDHTSGTAADAFTPRAMVADNDLALGMIIEAISTSSVWKDTAVFVVEDDAQNGPDHVDSHRTVALAISPYTHHRGRDNSFYSTASMLRTMELILGLEPMSQYDAGALPMYNAFHAKADTRAYKCRPVPENLRTVRNSPEAWGAELSAKLDFSKEDAADDLVLSEIVWRSVRGGVGPMPAPMRAAFVMPVAE
ncbi:MAG: bifunctional YncE family protein/alkaline phosphatase family protein [Candidatus Hydrogenedentes bacterium]|nr:bifunctional YncE family protein/alkaline phosphatase family protein [Candidatus Hydrogenedentota bacterium]